MLFFINQNNEPVLFLKNGILKRLIVCLILLSCAGTLLGAAAAQSDMTMQTEGTANMNPANIGGSYSTCSDVCQAHCEPGCWYTDLCRDVCEIKCFPPPE